MYKKGHFLDELQASSLHLLWYDKASVYHEGRIDSVVRQAERIINTSLPSIESIYINRMNNKTTKMLKDKHHPAHDYFQFLPSMKRMRTFKGNKRFTNSFFPQAVKYYNSTRDKWSFILKYIVYVCFSCNIDMTCFVDIYLYIVWFDNVCICLMNVVVT